MGRTGPSTLKREAARLSEPKHEGWVLVRLLHAYGTLERAHYGLGKDSARLSEQLHA